MRRIILLLVSLFYLGACVYPTTVTESKEERPTIAIVGAMGSDELFVDGLSMGAANSFSGGSALLVEPGMHKIEVRRNGAVVMFEQVFLGRNEFKTFTVTHPR